MLSCCEGPCPLIDTLCWCSLSCKLLSAFVIFQQDRNQYINEGVYLRFMSPLIAREKMFDKVPPGQQPQMSSAAASMVSSWRILARLKAVRGMMTNWASKAMATPLGLRRWALILEISIEQPRDIMVMKSVTTLRTSRVRFKFAGTFMMPILPLPETL